MINIKKTIYILLLSFPILCYGQFTGGIGDGHGVSQISTSISGEDLGAFSGSIGDGFSFEYGPALAMNPGCDYNIVLNEIPIIPGAYKADNNIFASGVVSAGEVTLQIGNQAELSPEFEVKIGQVFLINIQPCASPISPPKNK